jgi:hypothetical protein
MHTSNTFKTVVLLGTLTGSEVMIGSMPSTARTQVSA